MSSDRVPVCCCVEGIFHQQRKENSKEHCASARTHPCLTLLRMSNGSDELPMNYHIPFMPVWKDSVMLCSLCCKPISGSSNL